MTPPITEILRLLSDPTRLRMFCLLHEEELAVAELQEILSMKQSRISTQLAQLKSSGLIEVRRSGKNSIYGAVPGAVDTGLVSLVERALTELPDARADIAALERIRSKRSDKARLYFDALAGKFGRTYCPGRSWKGLAETLLKLMPPMVVADLGAGEGTFSQLLAQRAEKVIAVDNSEKMVEYGSRVSRDNGFTNLEYRLGEIEAPPIDDGICDLVFLSQALHHAARPASAVHEAFRILKPGGRVVILDLLRHEFEDARDLYADVWLGFSEVEVQAFLRDAGFTNVDVATVDTEPDPPHFQTLLASGMKPL